MEILADARSIARSSDMPKYWLFSSTRGLCWRKESRCWRKLELRSDWLFELDRARLTLLVDRDLCWRSGRKNSCCWEGSSGSERGSWTSFTESEDMRLPRLTHPNMELRFVGDRACDIWDLGVKTRRQYSSERFKKPQLITTDTEFRREML